MEILKPAAGFAIIYGLAHSSWLWVVIGIVVFEVSTGFMGSIAFMIMDDNHRSGSDD